MIVLDTNVLSELIRPRPDPKVVNWLRDQARSRLFTTAVSRGEMLLGALVLPDGQRKRRLQDEIQAIFEIDMAGRVLAYDSSAADAQAQFSAMRKAQGRPVTLADAMIAGIAHSRGAALATRNVRDFEGCGVALIDPWH